jgi:hypothetical protein
VPLLRVRGDWKPLIGTLFGGITLGFQSKGSNTQVEITIVAAVDNAYALMSSPGERIKSKFLEAFSQRSTAPNDSEGTDVSSRLKKLEVLRSERLISESEYEEARREIISRI